MAEDVDRLGAAAGSGPLLPGKWRGWGAPLKLSRVPKCLLASRARDQGAEHRCAGRRA